MLVQKTLPHHKRKVSVLRYMIHLQVTAVMQWILCMNLIFIIFFRNLELDAFVCISKPALCIRFLFCFCYCFYFYVLSFVFLPVVVFSLSELRRLVNKATRWLKSFKRKSATKFPRSLKYMKGTSRVSYRQCWIDSRSMWVGVQCMCMIQRQIIFGWTQRAAKLLHTGVFNYYILLPISQQLTNDFL